MKKHLKSTSIQFKTSTSSFLGITELWGYEEPIGLKIYCQYFDDRGLRRTDHIFTISQATIRAYIRRLDKGKKEVAK